VPFTNHHIEEMKRQRQKCADQAERARLRGLTSLADSFDRVVADWDFMLGRQGTTRDAT
jgi:hypothetical protein